MLPNSEILPGASTLPPLEGLGLGDGAGKPLLVVRTVPVVELPDPLTGSGVVADTTVVLVFGEEEEEEELDITTDTTVGAESGGADVVTDPPVELVITLATSVSSLPNPNRGMIVAGSPSLVVSSPSHKKARELNSIDPRQLPSFDVSPSSL